MLRRVTFLAVLLLAACQAAPSATPFPTFTVSPNPTSTPQSSPSPESLPTLIPARTDAVSHLVLAGEKISSIAAAYNLAPQTVLWANYELLFDNPDFLMEGMQLEILPGDGLMHQVGGIDTVESLAAFFLASSEAIIAWPQNEIDANNPTISAGQWLFIPDGQRASRWRQMPDIFRASANLDPQEFGNGACSADFTVGPIGDGSFSWPLPSQVIAGENFSDWHPGIDISSFSGAQIFASDDGVVVFSGWSNLGYGNLAMIDHGNGYVSLYSGLQSVLAPCGAEIHEGDPIALAAHTGHPSGPLLHFEIRRDGIQIDPLSVLP